jgi:hypothetical protein
MKLLPVRTTFQMRHMLSPVPDEPAGSASRVCGQGVVMSNGHCIGHDCLECPTLGLTRRRVAQLLASPLVAVALVNDSC